MMHNPVLVAENVTKRFGHGPVEVVAVRNVSLEVNRGDIVLIMGPSGSGKTTLLSMLGALLRPSSGRIMVDDTLISSLPEKKLPEVRRRHFGFVFQDFNLLSALTARENVEVELNLAGAKGREARQRAENLLRRLDLGERLEFRPHQLSGGEKQRVAIARALANNPAVILADEPTANLDRHIGHEVMSVLGRIAHDQGHSVVIVSHDERIRDIADRVLWLEDGEFRVMAARAEDPVCRMSVDKDTVFTAEHRGQTYYFCADGCRREFMANPNRFVSN